MTWLAETGPTLTGNKAADLVIAVSLTVGALTVIARAGIRAAHVIRTIDELREDLLGGPNTPTLSERVRTIEDRTRELVPNGGASIADTVRRADRTIQETRRQVEAAAREMNSLHAQNTGRLDRIEGRLEENLLRERAYIASLHELGIDIDITRSQQERPSDLR